MMTNEPMRHQFEQSFVAHHGAEEHLFAKRKNGEYVSSSVDSAWWAWQAATLKANQWQPIETAPRDGTPILLLLPLSGNLREGDRRVYEGRWYAPQEKWTSHNGFLLFDGATDWQPLPLPPTQGGK